MSKKPKGIFIFAILGIIVGLTLTYLILTIKHFRVDLSYSPNIYDLICFFVAVGFISSGLALFSLKGWSRNVYLFSMMGYVLLGLIGAGTFRVLDLAQITQGNYPATIIGLFIFFILPAGAALYYFSKKEIKELFKKNV
ncbi:MAG: hypothetical protein JSW40_03455 [Candidatus Omnitrophota bacterium]|nr:MAG: hypothetical protein JSW40_03455 [Candidatus Omnitrophota bacterium]